MNAQCKEDTFEGWAVVELMGHRKLAGYVTTSIALGAPMLRLDIPATLAGPAATQFYSPSALYCLTPTTEQTAVALAGSRRPKPVSHWELKVLDQPRPHTPPRPEDNDDYDDNDPDDDYDCDEDHDIPL